LSCAATLNMCEPASMKLAGVTSQPAHRLKSSEYASIASVICREITTGPLERASFTADRPRNQLQQAPQKPKNLAFDTVQCATS
jgi:hypothetical protein